MNSRIDEIYKTATDLKTNSEFNQAEVQDLKKAGDPISEIEQELGEVHEQIGFPCGKIEYPDSRSPRNEIKLDGIPEESGENLEKTESKAKMALEIQLKLPFELYIERTHRFGK